MNFRRKDGITINFRYKTDEVVPLIRLQPFTWKDLFSYIGGLLGMSTDCELQNILLEKIFSGLFAGISVLSLVEVFYFFTIRIVGNIFS